MPQVAKAKSHCGDGKGASRREKQKGRHSARAWAPAGNLLTCQPLQLMNHVLVAMLVREMWTRGRSYRHLHDREKRGAKLWWALASLPHLAKAFGTTAASPSKLQGSAARAQLGRLQFTVRPAWAQTRLEFGD